MKQTVETTAATTSRIAESEPLILRKRIGPTLYEVSVRFSQTSRETMQDKLLRLIEREVFENDA
jgi:hypothetical protein